MIAAAYRRLSNEVSQLITFAPRNSKVRAGIKKKRLLQSLSHEARTNMLDEVDLQTRKNNSVGRTCTTTIGPAQLGAISQHYPDIKAPLAAIVERNGIL